MDYPYTANRSDSGGMSPERIAQLLWLTIGPFVFFAGVIGNIIILITLRKGKLSGNRITNLYVTLIAAADLVVLLTGMVNEWLKYQLINLEDLHPVSCKVIKVTVYVCMDVAIWLVVLFTVERFIAVCLPFYYRQNICCQTKLIYCYVIVCFVAGFLLNGATLVTRGAERATVNNETVVVDNCGYTSEEARDYELHIKPWLIFTFATVMPIIILVTCNTLVLCKLSSFRRRTLQRSISSESGFSESERLLKQITIMCVSVSFAFVIFITPSVILLIGKVNWEQNDSYKIMKAINNLLVYCNHSINCYLYLIIGRQFQTEPGSP